MFHKGNAQQRPCCGELKAELSNKVAVSTSERALFLEW